MAAPNELAQVQVRVADLTVMLDALEEALEAFDEFEDCDSPDCLSCTTKQGTLIRLRDTLLEGAPKVEV